MKRVCVLLIALATPHTDRDAIVGDVLEEFDHVERTSGSRAARRWLHRELRRSLWLAPALHLAARGAHVNSTESELPLTNRGAGEASPLATAAVVARDALRGLRAGKATASLAFAILTLTLAAGTVTFSVVDAVALRPLPYGSPERLVDLSLPSATPGSVYPPSPQDYFSWLEGTRAFESLGAARFVAALQLEENGAAESLSARAVTANLFDVLGVRPAAGRFFGSEHEQGGGPLAVVLSHALWVRRFGADPRVVGRFLTFHDRNRQVVGVLPEGVSYPIVAGAPADLYVPYVASPRDRVPGAPRTGLMSIVGRMRSGVSVEQARADVNRISSAIVVPLHDRVAGPAKSWMILVLSAVGFVLLVACANVANLLLARGTARAHELATREALGASRRRLAAELLLEGVFLSLASGAAALALSFWGVQLAKSSLPPGLTRVSSIAINGRVLSASILAAILCGVVFASAPAWFAARSDLMGLMKASGGPLLGGRRRDRTLGAFLVADIAFVCVLLVATALVVTSFRLVTTADLGFDRRNVMRLWCVGSLKGVAEGDRPVYAAVFRKNLLERARSVPGVTQVALSDGGSPLSGSSGRYSITIPGFGETKLDNSPETLAVTPGYFRVMGMQLIRGRMFEESDRAGAPSVMVINDVAARRYFGGRDPIGQVVTGYRGRFNGPTTIVGVMRAVHVFGPEGDVRPELYTPLDQKPYMDFDDRATRGPIVSGNLLVRTNRDPSAFSAGVRQAIRPLLTTEPTETKYVDDDFRRLTAGRRFNARLMALFGLIAIAIGALGVYGTMAFFVARQVRTIGLRMALGASRLRVMRSVLWDALRRVAVGSALGLAGAWSVSNAFTSFVFGVRPTEPLVYVGVAAFLAVVGLAAALLPAFRASRLDPLEALRTE